MIKDIKQIKEKKEISKADARTIGKDFYEEIVTDVRRDYERRSDERRTLEAKWRLCGNYLTGNQNGYVGVGGRIEEQSKRFYWQSNECYNHIAPILETRMSKLHNVNTAISVRPETADKSDIESAKFATRIIKTVANANDMPTLLTRAIAWSETTGTSFYKLIWNDNRGKSVGEKDGAAIKTGEVEITVCSPYEIYPDNLNIPSVQGQRSIIHARSMSIDEVELMFGERIAPEKGSISQLTKRETTVSGGGSMMAYAVEENDRQDCVTIIERYTRPTKEYPRGKLEIVAGDTCLHASELPFVDRDGSPFLPFIRQVCIDSGECFYGANIIERIIPVQKAYNAVKNRKHEMLNRISAGVIAVEDGSVDIDELEEEGLAPGKILVYRQGSDVPKMLEIGKIPTDYYREEANLLSEFTMISGVSELMQYTSIPNNMTSGIAISLLIEQDDSKLMVSANGIRQAMRETGKMILSIYKCMATQIRLDLIAGENGDVEKKYWTGSDISSDDIVFDTESEVINSPSSRKNMIYELLKLGLLSDENGSITDTNKLKVLEILGLGNWESIKSNAELHQKKASRENIDLEKGGDVTVNPYDDHKLHIEEHIRLLIGAKLSTKGDKMLTAHISDHKSAQTLILGEAGLMEDLATSKDGGQ